MRTGHTQTNAASNMWISLLAIFSLFFLAGCVITENVDPKYDPSAVQAHRQGRGCIGPSAKQVRAGYLESRGLVIVSLLSGNGGY